MASASFSIWVYLHSVFVIDQDTNAMGLQIESVFCIMRLGPGSCSIARWTSYLTISEVVVVKSVRFFNYLPSWFTIPTKCLSCETLVGGFISQIAEVLSRICPDPICPDPAGIYKVTKIFQTTIAKLTYAGIQGSSIGFDPE